MAVKNKELTTQSELNDKHLLKCVVKRGLDKYWLFANCRWIDKFEASEILHCEAKSGGILFEGANGQYQFKPDKPWSDLQGKKAAKYRTAAGDEWDAYLPCHPTDPNYWDDIEALKELCYKINDVPMLLITEGVFKAISSCSHNLPTISLLGVEMGLTSSKNDPQGKRFLVDTLEKYAKHGFGFIFAFDADIYTNKNVLKALVKLAEQLQKFDVPVYNLPKWDESEGKGIDDYIQNNGIEAFREKLIAQTTSYERWKSEYAEDIFDNKPPKADIIGKELAEEYEDRWIYCGELKSWLIYGLKTNGVWSLVEEDYIEAQIDSILEARNISGYGTNSYIKNILGKLKRKLFEQEWKSKPLLDWLPFQNGVLELATMKLHEHSPDFKLNWQFSRPYTTVETNWSKINNWLDEATKGNKEHKELLLCFAAAVLRGMNHLQKFLHLIGSGGGGKSTFTNLLTAVIGEENTVNLNLSDLEDKHEIARIFGKRLVILPDQDKASKSLSNFKRLTGQDRLSGRKLFHNGFEYVFGGLLVTTSNFPIFHSNIGSWLTRRVIMIPFNHKCPDSKKRDLNKEFQPELSAFTNYLLSIPIEKIENTLKGKGQSKLSSVTWATQTRSDGLSAWLNDCIVQDELSSVAIGRNKDEWAVGEYNATESTLYGSYALYSKQTNRSIKSPQNFSADLLELMNNVVGWKTSKSRTKSATVIKGIRLRTPSDTELTVEEILEPDYRQGDDPGVDLGDDPGVDLKPLENKESVKGDDLFSKSLDSKKEKNNPNFNPTNSQGNVSISEIKSESSPALSDPLKEVVFKDSKNNSNLGDKVNTFNTNHIQQEFEVNTKVNTQVNTQVNTKESDWKTYPYNSKDVPTLKQRANKVKERIFKCSNKNELDKLILCPEGKATFAEFNWLKENLFTESERKRVESIFSCFQTNLVNQPEVERNCFDFNDIRKDIDRLMQSLGWSKQKGKQYLIDTYNKKSRVLLSDDELVEFWEYLKDLVHD